MAYNKAWEVGYVRDRARGRRRYVVADDTRTRLQDLAQTRVPLRALADASGLSDTALARILQGRHGHVQRRTADRVAAVTLTEVYDRASGLVPSIGAVRRVEALMALGWRKSDLLAHGVPPVQLVTRPRHLISADGWRQVRQVYDRLSMTPGSCPTTRNRAAARGYVPPLAWDEETMDDPRAGPDRGRRSDEGVDPVAIARAVSAITSAAAVGGWDARIRLTRNEGVAVARTLTTRGASDREIATVLGASSRTVLRLRGRHEIPTGRPGASQPRAPADGRPSSAPRVPTEARQDPGHADVDVTWPVPPSCTDQPGLPAPGWPQAANR